jgi:hypothetical protein
MTKNNALGPANRDTSEWNNAWDVVRRLAAVRRITLREPANSTPADQSTQDPDAEPHPVLASSRPGDAPDHSTALDTGQYARAMAEIEQASAALRRAEPALEAWPVDTNAQGEPGRPRSVWILVGGIWVSTVLVVASAIGATLLLLG